MESPAVEARANDGLAQAVGNGLIDLINKIVEQRLEEYTRPTHLIPQAVIAPKMEPELLPKPPAEEANLPAELLAKIEAIRPKRPPTHAPNHGCKHMTVDTARKVIALSKRGIDIQTIATALDVRKEAVRRCVRGISFCQLRR